MKPIARKENIVVQNTAYETLVYDLTVNKAYLLNETSAFVWDLCDGKNDIAKIREQVTARFKEPVGEGLVWLAIEQLKKEKLLENGDEMPISLRETNRRDLIKQIGLGTMIALPLISKIIAPTAAQAVSGACVASACPDTCCNLNVCVTRGSLAPGAPCSADCACNFACDFLQNPPTCFVI